MTGTSSADVMHCVWLPQVGERYLCREDESLLEGMARLSRKGIPRGCLNGGCGVCKVLIRKGRVRKSGPMSRAHISEQDELNGVVLACRVRPVCDIELDVIGKLQKPVLARSGTELPQAAR